MCATTRRGHVVEERDSWDRCLNVNRDLRRPRPSTREIGEEATNGWEEDMLGRMASQHIRARLLWEFPESDDLCDGMIVLCVSVRRVEDATCAILDGIFEMDVVIH